MLQHYTSRATVCLTVIDVFNNITYVSTIKKPMKTKNKIPTYRKPTKFNNNNNVLMNK